MRKESNLKVTKHLVFLLGLSLLIVIPLSAYALTFTQTGEADFSQGTFLDTKTDGSGNVTLIATTTENAWAQDTAVGQEYQTGNQTDTTTDTPILSDGSGGFFIAWVSERDAGARTGATNLPCIFLQHIDGTGSTTWTTNGVGVTDSSHCAIGGQDSPGLALDGSGGVIITWRDATTGNGLLSTDIYAQRIDANGNRLWTDAAVPVATSTNIDYQLPQILTDGAGGAFIVWNTSSGANFARRINSSGTLQWADKVSLRTGGAVDFQPHITTDGAGGFIATWAPSGNTQVYAQRIDANGNRLWNAAGVLEGTGSGANPLIASDGSGGAIITFGISSNGFDIGAQHIDSTGAATWTATTTEVVVVTATNSQFAKQILADGSGGAFISWFDLRTTGNNYDMYAQHFTSTGSTTWTANGVGIATDTGDDRGSYMVLDGSGGIYMTWAADISNANSLIRLQHLNSSGVAQLDAAGLRISQEGYPFQTNPEATSDGAGGIFMAWEDNRHDTNINNFTDVYAQRVTANPTPTTLYPNGFFGGIASSSTQIDWSTFTLTSQQTTAAGQNVTFKTRLIWTDEFDDGDTSNVVYDFGATASTSESGGILTINNFSSRNFSDFLIEPGLGDDFFPEGTIIRARVRLNGAVSSVDIFPNGDWGDGVTFGETLTTGQWTTIEFTSAATLFTDLDFEISTNNASFAPGDSIDIDWVEIEPPLDFDDWNDLIGNNIQTGSGYTLEYRAALTTTDHLATPSLQSVTISDGTGGGSGGSGGGGGGGGSTSSIFIGGGNPGAYDWPTATTTASTTNAPTSTSTNALIDPTASSTALFPRTLSLYSVGPDVALLQDALKVLGYFKYPVITDTFGPVTLAAVTAFQKDNGIDPVGIAGPITRAALEEHIAGAEALGCSFPTQLTQNPPMATSTFAGTANFARASFNDGTLSNLYGSIALPGGATQPVAARVASFIDAHANLFGVTSSADLKLVEDIDTDTGTSSVPFSQKPTEQVMLRYERMIQGLPVFNSSVVITVGGGGQSINPFGTNTLYSITSLADYLRLSSLGSTSVPVIESVVAHLPLSTEPNNSWSLTPAQALEIALAGTSATGDAVEPVIYSANLTKQCQSGVQAAYDVRLINPGVGNPTEKIIDAQTGQVLFANAPFAPAQNFNVMSPDAATALSMWNNSSRFSSASFTLAGGPVFHLVYSDQGQAEPGLSPYDYPEATTMYSMVSNTYNYFRTAFGRDSIDGRGGPVTVEYDPDRRLASLDGGAMWNPSVFPGQLLVNDPSAIDQTIVSHEYAHGVLYAQGIEYGSGESAAVSEGLADLFAFWQTGTYLITFNSNPAANRNAANGADYGAPTSPDAHTNSLVLSHAAYLAARGGSEHGIDVKGIGDGKVSQIFYLAVDGGLLSGYPDFTQTSQALQTAARNAAVSGISLNGKTISYGDCGSVLNGLAAVGLGSLGSGASDDYLPSYIGDKDYDCVSDNQDDCPAQYDPKQDNPCKPPPPPKLSSWTPDFKTPYRSINNDHTYCFFVALGFNLQFDCGTPAVFPPGEQYCYNDPGFPGCLTSGIETTYIDTNQNFVQTGNGPVQLLSTISMGDKFIACEGKWCSALSGPPWTNSKTIQLLDSRAIIYAWPDAIGIQEGDLPVVVSCPLNLPC